MIAEHKHHTIRTLHTLGFSVRAIAAAIGEARSTLYASYPDILGEDFIKDKGKLKMSHFKDATLCGLAIQSEEPKDKIAALRAVEGGTDSDTATDTAVDTSKIRLEIINDISAK